jgi:flagellar assembly protein FliH
MEERVLPAAAASPASPAPPLKLEPAPKRPRAEILDEARDEAEMIILAAKNEAQILRDDALAEAEGLRRRSLEEGREEGRSKGFSKGKAEADRLLAQARRTLEEAEAERESILSSLEGEIVDFIIRISRKLIGEASKLNPEAMRQVLREGLDAVSVKGEAKVRVSEADHDNVKKMLKDFSSFGKLTLVSDPSLGPMECVVETPRGTVVSSLDEQMRGLAEDLHMLLESGE